MATERTMVAKKNGTILLYDATRPSCMPMISQESILLQECTTGACVHVGMRTVQV